MPLHEHCIKINKKGREKKYAAWFAPRDQLARRFKMRKKEREKNRFSFTQLNSLWASAVELRWDFLLVDGIGNPYYISY